jgi:hypothetical protein
MNLPHGYQVMASAVKDGFRGQVVPLNQSGMGEAASGLNKPGMTAQETRAYVSDYASKRAVGLLNTETGMVNMAQQTGAKNSALNISMGVSPASISSGLYFSSIGDPSQPAGPRLQNLATAYGLDIDKLNSSDPKVAGPERARLQQGLIGDVSKGIGGPEVARAKRDFATAVGRFESGQNSVVISAGNDGETLKDLKKSAYGVPVKSVPDNFFTNVLDTPQATMVGATRWFESSKGLVEKPANYSNKNSGVDVYASGSLAGVPYRPDLGTSFSAPRVAATMATLHKQNPKMSSAQVEALMMSKLTRELDTSSGSISVLDFQRSSDLMVGRR